MAPARHGSMDASRSVERTLALEGASRSSAEPPPSEASEEVTVSPAARRSTDGPRRSMMDSSGSLFDDAGTDAAALADASSSLRQLMAAAKEDSLRLALSVTDEEDAVMLYRCTRLAERSPILLEAVDHRLSLIHI